GLAGSDSLVRLVRAAPRATDSAWARAGGVLVNWPLQLEGNPPASDWHARAPVDTAGGVVAGDVAVVYPFERRWQAGPRAGARIVARWIDGEPAALETRLGAGCTRDILIPVPSRGDLVLRSDFGRLLSALAAPCGAAGTHPGGVRDLAALAGRGALASRASLPVPEIVSTPLVPWLLAAALLLALVELRVRRRALPQHRAPSRPRAPGR
ncbi:MAG TPA: hypothetical protein VJQ44_14370, partial [Gemmatimonadales bacterium]|nr:hypothetical protein [Gemmatimonadales bacterium]